MAFLRALSSLSDRQLLRSTQRAARSSRRTTAELIAHISEVDRRKLYRQEACSSMFTYCTQRLGLSEDATAKRIQVARKVQQFPALLDALAQGKVHLTGLKLLAPHLTEENCSSVLKRAEGKSKRKIEELCAALAPRPDVAPRIRKLPSRRLGQRVVAASEDGDSLERPAEQSPLIIESIPESMAESMPESMAESMPDLRPRPASRIQPLSPARYKIEFTAGKPLTDKFERARELLRHRVPTGDLVQIVDRALTLLLAKLEKERFGLVAAPQSSASNSESSRHVPNRVKREVYQRDEGRCTYSDAKGRRCIERGMLEYDHIIPYARGGETTVDNVRLRCRAHNQLHAEHCYGTRFMEQKRLFG